MLSVPEHLGTEGCVCAESRDIKNSITLDLESTTLLDSDTPCSQADIDPSDRILLLLVSFLTVFLSVLVRLRFFSSSIDILMEFRKVKDTCGQAALFSWKSGNSMQCSVLLVSTEVL